MTLRFNLWRGGRIDDFLEYTEEWYALRRWWDHLGMARELQHLMKARLTVELVPEFRKLKK